MAKRSKTNADVLRKEPVGSKRRRYLEGGDKSHTRDKVKEMAHGTGRLRTYRLMKNDRLILYNLIILDTHVAPIRKPNNASITET